MIPSLLAALSIAVATPPPNIVLIIADDQAHTDYGFMGHPQIRTPRLDRLAAQSLAFRHGYVPSSLCSPSLATILTGLYPHQHGITSNDPPGTSGARGPAYLEGRRRLEQMVDDLPTLPRRLAEKGYLSLQTGKWWGGSFSRGGFTHGMTHGDTARGGRHGDDGLEIGRQTMKPIDDFLDLAASRSRPFLVWYAPMLPHQPHNPPDRLLDHYRATAPTDQIARYWAMCEWFDETVGALLDTLDRRGLSENTLVVFLADNGWIQDPDRNAYAPRSKQSPYDGGLRTPILVRWPGHATPATVDTPVSSIDVAPTLLRAAGLEPDGLPGLSLLDPVAVARRDAIFGACFDHDAVDLSDPSASLRYRWVVSGGWKLIAPAPRLPDAPVPELYDLSTDPDERRNLFTQAPETAQRLTDRLDHWWPGDPPLRAEPH